MINVLPCIGSDHGHWWWRTDWSSRLYSRHTPPGKQGGGPDLSQDSRQVTNTKNLSLEDEQMGKYRGWVWYYYKIRYPFPIISVSDQSLIGNVILILSYVSRPGWTWWRWPGGPSLSARRSSPAAPARTPPRLGPRVSTQDSVTFQS